jgi:hypothetical protein
MRIDQRFVDSDSFDQRPPIVLRLVSWVVLGGASWLTLGVAFVLLTRAIG